MEAYDIINENAGLMESDGLHSMFPIPDVERMMIQFAKFHVEAALKEASIGNGFALNKQTILNAYPLENIK